SHCPRVWQLIDGAKFDVFAHQHDFVYSVGTSSVSEIRSEERRVGKECGARWRREGGRKPEAETRECAEGARSDTPEQERCGDRAAVLALLLTMYPLVRIGVACFFFQAEDGIRDRNVTGVQTCALPIFRIARESGNSLTGPNLMFLPINMISYIP